MCFADQKVLLQKELFLFYVSQGELYDAYHLFKGEIQVSECQSFTSVSH